MTLKLQEQLNEALNELKQSQAREEQLANENRAILQAISRITVAKDKHQIFNELKSVLSLYIKFSDFLVLTKSREQIGYQTLLSASDTFHNVCWQDGSKFQRALSGESILLFELSELNEFAPVRTLSEHTIESALVTGVSGAISDSIIVMLGESAGQFSLESRKTLSRFRPLLERALIDIERTEQLQQLVDIKTHQLRLAQEKAEQANQAKSRFLAMMSHELRTPLNAVLGYIDVLSDDLESNDQQKMLSKMESSAEFLLVIINDILELSRIESGHFSLQCQWVDIKSELEFTLEHFHLLADAKGLQLSVDINIQDELLMHVDSARVMQIVFNLLGNAIKFTHSGTIKLSAALLDSNLCVDVVDTGIGIEPTRLDAIFKQFKQADDSITRNYGGTGLGLSITKHLVELMEGDIFVESTLGQGSKFSLTIPVSVRQEHKAETALITENSSDKSLSILVVEDTKTNQMVLKLLLERMSHSVVIANNGEEAVNYLKDNMDEVDMIFMDISMPVMDGLTATKEIRKFCNTLPVVALTAHAMEKDKQTCLNSGMNAFVSKPIRGDEIKKTISTIFG